MKFYTRVFKAKCVFSTFIIIWISLLTLITINHSLSCVNPKGQLKESCKSWTYKGNRRNVLRAEYKKLLKEN